MNNVQFPSIFLSFACTHFGHSLSSKFWFPVFRIFDSFTITILLILNLDILSTHIDPPDSESAAVNYPLAVCQCDTCALGLPPVCLHFEIRHFCFSSDSPFECLECNPASEQCVCVCVAFGCGRHYLSPKKNWKRIRKTIRSTQNCCPDYSMCLVKILDAFRMSSG